MAKLTVVDKSGTKLWKLRALHRDLPREPIKPGEPIKPLVFPGEPAEADTLRQLIAVLHDRNGIILEPFEPPRFFTYTTVESPDAPGERVDIHVMRQGDDICLKQDLDFRFVDGDEVSIGACTC